MSQDVIFERLQHDTGDLGLIRLNRLDNLNALTHEMVLSLYQQLCEWKQDSKIKAVVIKSEHPRAFCAGGDIRAIYDKGKEKDPTVVDFFYDEYRLNYLIHFYPKPYIAIMNGINMGGGVGISLHGSHKIAVDDLVLAMPETGIGLFPDIGGGYLLSHCHEPFGLYLALTGEKINAADAVMLEWADKVMSREGADNFIAQLLELDLKNESKTTVYHLMRSMGTKPPTTDASLNSKTALIESCFEADSLEEIFANLRASQDEAAPELLEKLSTKSPMSLKLTFKQIQDAASMTFPKCLKMEYRMVNRFMEGHDFFEGVRALLVDKDKNPQWSPASIDAVTDEMMAEYFAPLERELNLEDLL